MDDGVGTVRNASSPRVAVLGAGVIGRVLAGRLHASGASTVLVARGQQAAVLAEEGVRLRRAEELETVEVPVVEATTPGEHDVVILTTRAAQLDGALDVVDRMGRPVVVTAMHLADRTPLLLDRVGRSRVVRAFPGLGGFLDRSGDGSPAGVVEWLDLGRRQPTTVEGGAEHSSAVFELLGRTTLPCSLTDDMDAWMAVHVVFVATLGGGVALAGGRAEALAGDRALLGRTCAAISDGFAALHARGQRIEPASVDVLHRRLPRWCAPLYWRRALQGPIGQVTIAPHVRASRDDELPLLAAEAIRIADGGQRGRLAAFLGPLAGDGCEAGRGMTP